MSRVCEFCDIIHDARVSCHDAAYIEFIGSNYGVHQEAGRSPMIELEKHKDWTPLFKMAMAEIDSLRQQLADKNKTIDIIVNVFSGIEPPERYPFAREVFIMNQQLKAEVEKWKAEATHWATAHSIAVLELEQYKKDEDFNPPVTCADNCSLLKKAKEEVNNRLFDSANEWKTRALKAEAVPEKDQLIAAVKKHLATLTDDGRIDFIHDCMKDYCERCGTMYIPCCCGPDFDD